MAEEVNSNLAREDQPRCLFLEIPTEIRLQIYSELFKPHPPISLFVSTEVRLWGQGFPNDIESCMEVCPQVENEIEDIIWDKLCFKVRVESFRRINDTRTLGQTKNLALLRKMRHVEICFPVFGTPNCVDLAGMTMQRTKPCTDALARNRVLRSITFNCDTIAISGGHSETAVEFMTLAFRKVILKQKDRGVKVRLINVDKDKSSRLCLKVFRDGGWKVAD